MFVYFPVSTKVILQHCPVPQEGKATTRSVCSLWEGGAVETKDTSRLTGKESWALRDDCLNSGLEAARVNTAWRLWQDLVVVPMFKRKGPEVCSNYQRWHSSASLGEFLLMVLIGGHGWLSNLRFKSAAWLLWRWWNTGAVINLWQGADTNMGVCATVLWVFFRFGKT